MLVLYGFPSFLLLAASTLAILLFVEIYALTTHE